MPRQRVQVKKPEVEVPKRQPPRALTPVPEPVKSAPKAKIGDFEVMCLLGKGSFGTVNLVRHLETQALFALKQIPKCKINQSSKQIAHIINERDTLRKLKSSKFCVHISDTFQDEVNLYLLLEYLPGGDLLNLIKNQKFISEGESLKFYAAEVICAVEFLHGQNIVFRDLKPENILLDAAGHIRLIDFGFSKQLLRSSQRCVTNCGTPGYSAPEVMLQGEQAGGYDAKKADIWSVGILLCEMIGGYTPFTKQENSPQKGKRADELFTRGKGVMLDPQQICETIMSGNLNLPRNMSSLAKDLVRDILVVDPNMRLELADIKIHKFFRGIKWEKIAARLLQPPFVPPLPQPVCASVDSTES